MIYYCYLDDGKFPVEIEKVKLVREQLWSLTFGVGAKRSEAVFVDIC